MQAKPLVPTQPRCTDPWVWVEWWCKTRCTATPLGSSTSMRVRKCVLDSERTPVPTGSAGSLSTDPLAIRAVEGQLLAQVSQRVMRSRMAHWIGTRVPHRCIRVHLNDA